MDPNFKRKRMGVILLAGIAVLAFIAVLIATGSGPEPEPVTQEQGSSQNAETPITNPVSPTANPETAASRKVTIDYLTSYGITTQQITSLQKALYTFAQPRKYDMRNIMTDSGSIKHNFPATPDQNHTYDFPVSFGDNTFQANLEVIGIYRVRLILKDPSNGKQIYDSGVVNGSSV